MATPPRPRSPNRWTIRGLLSALPLALSHVLALLSPRGYHASFVDGADWYLSPIFWLKNVGNIAVAVTVALYIAECRRSRCRGCGRREVNYAACCPGCGVVEPWGEEGGGGGVVQELVVGGVFSEKKEVGFDL